MKLACGTQIEARTLDERLSAKRSITLPLALALFWAGGATPALATSGAFALVDIYDPSANEQAGTFFANDPATSTLELVLVPESSVYANGATSATISLRRFASSGNAAADLASGTLRAFASSSSGINTYARVGFSDALMPAASGLMHYEFEVAGTLTGSAGGAGGWLAIDGNIVVGTRGEVDSCFVAGPNICKYAFDIPVTAGVPVQFTSAIEAGAVDATVDLSRTATLRVTGVLFTSESGVFLTAVPEPSSLLLLLVAGLAGLGRLRGLRLS